MDTKLLVTDLSGRHNNNPSAPDRILKGASWRKQRVVMVMPSADLIPAKVCLSLWGIIFPPNQNVVRLLALGSEVGKAYSETIEQVLAHPDLSTWEYILTIEHDSICPGDGVLRLIEHLEANPKLCAVSGLYWTKGEGGVPQCWGDVSDPVMNFRPQPPPDEHSLLRVNGIGMGMALWRMKHFKHPELKRPFFETKASAQGAMTQDLDHAVDARKRGCQFAVAGNVRVGHYDHAGLFGPAEMVW